MGFSTSLPHHDENEEEMLRRAIAMSLQDEEEKEIHYLAGTIKTAQIWSRFVEKRKNSKKGEIQMTQLNQVMLCTKTLTRLMLMRRKCYKEL